MDWKGALDLAQRRKDPLPDKVVYDCAQCIEKYLKAFLVLHKKPFRFRHDLTDLRRRCQDVDDDFQLIEDDAILLNRWGSEIRYPGLSAAADDVKEAIAAMKRVRAFVRAKLGLR
ncbi:MAG: HEPN domain-containing protein [Chloroflexi bacterium]|nr:HEPN domain-containing protein [Chloroflexota bacterium]